MPTYRCLKHDLVFESYSDHRKPGSNATPTLAAHPHDGHPDCPQCIEAAKTPPTREELVAAARVRAAQAQAAAQEAANAAAAAAAEAAALG